MTGPPPPPAVAPHAAPAAAEHSTGDERGASGTSGASAISQAIAIQLIPECWRARTQP